MASILLIVSIFVPIWKIELDAPQYPEGLSLLIFANKIGGQVDIINGLNHYIGMQTLHSENFIEFTLLPFIISGFALFGFVAALIGRQKWIVVLLVSFVIFGIIAMADFWRWEYNYGHNLDPKAAIIVPGMAYQPPLIGFKQLLNFGAYSIPALGGWLLVISGALILITVLYEKGVMIGLRTKKMLQLLLIPMIIGLNSCSTIEPELIGLNKDVCDFCKMTISDGRYACEMITNKGRVYKFDDLGCLLAYKKENKKRQCKYIFINDYDQNKEMVSAENAFYVESAHLNSPMGGNCAAFKDSVKANKLAKQFAVKVSNWSAINGL